jgi:mannosyltransferase OCH1-like enzyme
MLKTYILLKMTSLNIKSVTTNTNNIPISNKVIITTPGDYTFTTIYNSIHNFSISVRRFDKLDIWQSLTLKIYSSDNNSYENIDLVNTSISGEIKGHEVYNVSTCISLEKINLVYNQLIPKVIIQTSETNICKELISLNGVKNIIELNPEYEYVFFNNVERRQFIQHNFDKITLLAYDTIVPGAFKADIFRYCYLYINGGCYFDFTMILRKPLRSFIKSTDEFLLCVDYDRNNSFDKSIGAGYLNSLIMSVKHNNKLLYAIDECVNNIIHKQSYILNDINIRGSQGILNVTGPQLLYKVLNKNVTDDVLRFKHIIINNDESLYENFQIVDINSKDLIATKKHTLWEDSDHYSILWSKKELFYKNIFHLNKSFDIFVYPHPFNDVFSFCVLDHKLVITRTDCSEGWWIDLKIKIVKCDTSETEVVIVGKCIDKNVIIIDLPTIIK